jgi:hypothetical protein
MGVMIMDDQLTIDTGEISTSPGIALTSQNHTEREKSPAKPVAKQQKGFFHCCSSCDTCE